MEEKKWGGAREGAGRVPLKESEKKKGAKIYVIDCIKEDIMEYGVGRNFSDKAVEIITAELNKRKKSR